MVWCMCLVYDCRGELRIYLREGLGTSGSPQIGDSVDGGDE
jgi:hypothetical protein